MDSTRQKLLERSIVLGAQTDTVTPSFILALSSRQPVDKLDKGTDIHDTCSLSTVGSRVPLNLNRSE